MGDQKLEGGGLREPQSSYSIVTYPAAKLPLSYEGFVQAKWKRSLRDGNDLYKMVDAKSYFDAYEFYINRLLSTPGAVIRIAVLSDSPDVALGWSLISGDTLHYVFVQRDARNKGIGTALVPIPIQWISHITHIGARIWNNPKHKHIKLNPFQ